MDNVRNITGSPIAGIDPHELVDTRPLCHGAPAVPRCAPAVPRCISLHLARNHALRLMVPPSAALGAPSGLAAARLVLLPGWEYPLTTLPHLALAHLALSCTAAPQP